MNYWRMSFRIKRENEIYEIWPICRKKGVAATGYYTYRHGYKEPVVGDCSKLSIEQYDAIWREKGVHAPAPQGSIKNLAYRMEKGDVIYVKQGPCIVGKGVVTSRKYRYNPDLFRDANVDIDLDWEHYVKVDWQKEFPKFRLNLGANQHTVLKLNEERLQKIREMESLYA